MKDIAFWFDNGSFAYAAVAVRGKVTYAKVVQAMLKAFGKDTTLHSYSEGTCLNRINKISLIVDPATNRKLG